MSMEKPNQPSEAEMQKAEKAQSVKQRVMGDLRGPDVLRAVNSGVDEETLRKMFVYIFSEKWNPRGKHALFSLDGHEIEIIQNLEEDHELSRATNDRGLDPKRYVGGKFGLVIDGVEVKDEALAEQMFKKYFDAARVVANDEMVEGEINTYRSRGEEHIKHDAYPTGTKETIRKTIERHGEYEGRGGVSGDFHLGRGKRAYETIAKNMIANSEELSNEEAQEKEAIRSFHATEAKTKQDAENARIQTEEEKKHLEALRVAEELLSGNNKEQQEAIKIAKGLL